MNPRAKFTKVTYPQAFDSQYIRVHWEFENDLKDILERSGHRGSEYAILLYPFEEKDNKNRSQWGYDSAKPIAQKRLEEVVGDDRY